MGRRARGELPAALVRARDRFRSWRRTRKPRARIPEPLWALAVELACAHGLHRTAATLKLDYYSLKKRVEAAAAREDASGPAFIELPSVLDPGRPCAGRECAIEFVDGAGVRLRVDLKGYDATEIVVVGRGLRESP